MKSKKRSKKQAQNRRKKILAFLVILAVAVAFIYAVTKPVPDSSESEAVTKNENGAETEIKSEIPVKNAFIKLPPNLEIPICEEHFSDHPDHQIRNYKAYSVCYREQYEQPEWSAYCLERSELVKNASRGNDFRADPEITTGSATPSDYKSSGYDRGHLAPAADFAFSEDTMSESFFMTNMSPQAPGLNRGIWKNLEDAVRKWADKFGQVYVVSGPVLEKPCDGYKSIGKNNVSVPEFYYKVILAPLYEDENDAATPEDCKQVVTIGFIFPNEKCAGSYFDYAVTVDEVEERTNLDFFSLLEDAVENEIENQWDIGFWMN